MIQQTNPKAGFLAYQEDIVSAVNRVLFSGWYILGEELNAFENEFSNYLNVNHSIGLANGTDAIELALRSLDIGPGDYVITVSNTAVATAAAIRRAGAEVVFVDVDPDRYTLLPESLEEALTTISNNKVKAVIPVHLYGQPADIYSIKEIADRYNIKIIEDCCQAHGAEINSRKVGTFGEFGCFSFYPTKNLGALGDAGMAVTNSSLLNDKIRSMREYGWKERNNSSFDGVNSRLDEIQAAILRIKLKHLDTMNTRRKVISDLYTYRLAGSDINQPLVCDNIKHVFHQYVIQCSDRDRLMTGLKAKGIGTLIHYPTPIHLQCAFRDNSLCPVSLKNTKKIASRILSLPMYPELIDMEVERICDILIELI